MCYRISLTFAMCQCGDGSPSDNVRSFSTPINPLVPKPRALHWCIPGWNLQYWRFYGGALSSRRWWATHKTSSLSSLLFWSFVFFNTQFWAHWGCIAWCTQYNGDATKQKRLRPLYFVVPGSQNNLAHIFTQFWALVWWKFQWKIHCLLLAWWKWL